MVLSSPYAVPPDRWLRAFIIGAWLAATACGIWVLAYPPRTYAGFGLIVTFLWAGLMITGSLLVLAGNLAQRYRIELPGLIFALGGVILYGLLSWDQVISGTWGSGPRALLLVMLALLLSHRARMLTLIHRRLQRLDDVARG